MRRDLDLDLESPFLKYSENKERVKRKNSIVCTEGNEVYFFDEPIILKNIRFIKRSEK